MPGTSGYDILAALRADKRTRQIPVIMLSSQDCSDMKTRSFAQYANDYLVKDPDPLELVARIRSHSRAYINWLELDAALRENQRIREQLDQANLQLQEANKRLQYQSVTDSLTGIANRRYFDAKMVQSLKNNYRQSDCLSLIILDVLEFRVTRTLPPYNFR